MSMSLVLAGEKDIKDLYDLQKWSFQPLLQKYGDYMTNPASEPMEMVRTRQEWKNTDYYFILLDGKHIGAIRVYVFKDYCRLSLICILPYYQDNGYAQAAMRMLEERYPKIHRWELETIKEESKLCYFYEKLGYRPTGIKKKLGLRMTLIEYEKVMENTEKEKKGHGNL